MSTPSKEYIYGNSRVILFSPLVNMTKEEQKEWFEEEWEKRNPVLLQIVDAAHDCLRDLKK